jgi:hypothetical protein
MKKLLFVVAISLFSIRALAQSAGPVWNPAVGYGYCDGGVCPSPLLPVVQPGGNYTAPTGHLVYGAVPETPKPVVFNWATTFGTLDAGANEATSTVTGTDDHFAVNLVMNPDGGASVTAQSLDFQVWLGNAYQNCTGVEATCQYQGVAGGTPGVSAFYAACMDGGSAIGVFNTAAFTPAVTGNYTWQCQTEATLGTLY